MTAPLPRREDLRLPPAREGERIGLLGGTFDPPHEGHLHVARTALARLELDRVWWMVTPGNPLKHRRDQRPLPERLALSRALVGGDRRIRVTGFEAAFGVRYTADTVALLAARRPRARFVWIMGADGLAGFHRWQDWRRIAGTVPIAVVDRPGSTLALLSSPAAHALARHRLNETDAPLLPALRPPAWVFLHGPRSALSSTALRAGAS